MDNFNSALAMAIKALATRSRTRFEVTQVLASRGVSPQDLDQVIQHLEAKGLLRDDLVAEELMQSRSGKRSMGNDRLAVVAVNKGLNPEYLVSNAPPERDRAAEALKGKYKDEPEPAKAARFLASRGFTDETIESVIDNLETIFG